MVDRIGKRALLMMFGSMLLIPVYLMMAYSHISLYVPMALMGVAFSLIPAVMWPSVAYIVDQSKLGTAYGLMTMIQNIGLFGFNLLVGWANDFRHADARQPWRLRARHVDLFDLGIPGLDLRVPAPPARNGPARTQPRNDHESKQMMPMRPTNLPISEDRDSKFGIVFKHLRWGSIQP